MYIIYIFNIILALPSFTVLDPAQAGLVIHETQQSKNRLMLLKIVMIFSVFVC
jgi:hypothetical protein